MVRINIERGVDPCYIANGCFRDKTTLNQIPFFVNSLNGNLDLNLNVTAQPSVAFKVSMLSAISGKTSFCPSYLTGKDLFG